MMTMTVGTVQYYVNNIWVRDEHQRLQNRLSIPIITIISFLKFVQKIENNKNV